MEKIYVNSPEFLEQDKEQIIKKHISGETLELDLEYDSDFRSAKIIRDFIDVLCRVMQIDSKWKSRLILISDEMNNNAIEYGTKKGDRNYLHISIQGHTPERKMIIEVQDKGNGESPKSAQEMETIRDEKNKAGFTQYHSIRGRGLFMIISTLVDSLYFKDNATGGLTVGITKNI